MKSGLMKNGGDGWGGFGDGGVVVLAEKSGESGGDLRLGDGGDVGAFAKWRSIWADDGEPDILGTLLLVAVLAPFFRATAAAMVSG